MSRDDDDVYGVPGGGNCNTRPFNACELCNAPGRFASESDVKPSHIQMPGRRGSMICANGHYFNPQKTGRIGLLEELERQYMNTHKE
jgi:hypothetical protein